MLRQRKEKREKRSGDHGPLNMSQPRVEASAHNYAPIVASRACCKKRNFSPGRVLMRLTAPAVCRFRFAYIRRVLSRKVRAFSSVTRKNCHPHDHPQKTANPKKLLPGGGEGKARSPPSSRDRERGSSNEENLKQIFLVNIDRSILQLSE